MLKKLVIFSIFLSTVPVVYGCSYGPPTVSQTYDWADTVIRARVVSHAKGEGDAQLTGMEVTKVYKGTIKPGEQITFSNRFGEFDFGYTLSFKESPIGSEMLIYTKAPTLKFWHASTCSRTAAVDYAKYDIAWIEALGKNRGRTRIYGFAGNGGYSLPTLSNARTKIVFRGGGKEFTAITNEDGFYELWDVPPGLYEAEALPTGKERVRAVQRAFSFTDDEYREMGKNLSQEEENNSNKYFTYVPPGRDAEMNFIYATWNRIGGRVTGPDGKPVAYALITLLPDAITKIYKPVVTNTDTNGNYEFRFVTPGEYRVVVNETGLITALMPFTTHCWEAEKNGSPKSALIKAGTEITDADIHIRKIFETVTVSGVLRYQDGKLFRDKALLVYRPAGRDAKVFGGGSVNIDLNGRFTIELIRGTKVKLTATGFMTPLDPKTCDPLNRNAKDHPIVKSSSMVINAVRDFPDLIIKLPFRGCVKPPM